ncbi:kinase-like domain-containing protein [Rhizophagus clarus]|uniref:Kinase-like domain-containing protein n=1 Tax=Rhizophagus clarus TaxID=94130 RepID=A0A8H3QV16_9GLOM|nr:kinase-like domain-containing protein [Rhizophagus clarus]
MEFVSYAKFKDVKFVAEGGFSKIYKATWIDGPIIWDSERGKHNRNSYKMVALKEIINSKNISSNELNELKFITWKEKLKYLGDIIYGLYKLHRANIIHKDLHSGNIFIDNLTLFKSAAISDLGLSKSSLDNNNDEIYGIIPYVAPEVLQGQKYTKASDVYSFEIRKRGIDNQIKDDNNDTVIRSLENENTDYLTKELKFDIEENKNSSGSRLPGKLSLTFNPFSVQDDIYYVERLFYVKLVNDLLGLNTVLSWIHLLNANVKIIPKCTVNDLY